MKSYDQLCAVARALDVVGDRWSLLIVRELLVAGSARFTDLQRGLPGVATNLLVQRLRDLEAQGVVRRQDAAPPATGILYGLTERGRALEGVLRELLKWGAPTVVEAPAEAAFQMHWLSLPARYLLTDRDPAGAPIVVRFGTVADGFDVAAHDGALEVGPCQPGRELSATVTGPGKVLAGVLQGVVPLEQAPGVAVEGDIEAVQRLLRARPVELADGGR